MNFPNSHRTGALAEIDIERLFMSWRWNVGQDRIDVGYDLCVTPDRAKYQGARFLVQVKGTAQKKRKGVVVAPVSKARLRQYASDVLPVFIVRAMPGGEFYWLHAQAWAESNQDRLRGSGTAGVRFDVSHALAHRDAFEAYLEKVLPGRLHETPGGLSDLAAESRFLNSLDPRLKVRLSVRENTKTHEVFATSEDVASQFTFSPLRSPENLERLRDAVEYGLPRAIEVENFQLTGSPLFSEIGASGVNWGTLTIGQASRQPGTVRLYPGRRYSISAAELALDADLFNGQKGAAIINEMRESVIDLSIRLVPYQAGGKATVSMGLRPALLADRPLQHIDALRPLAVWTEQVAAQGSMFIELAFNHGRAPLAASDEGVNKLRPFLHWARTLSRLHLVAKALDSSIALPLEFELSAEDVGDIDLAYMLLKGERRAIDLGPIEFEPDRPIGSAGNTFFCTTTLAFAILGWPLGHIPVAIELANYSLEEVANSSRMRLTKGETGQAWISYAESHTSEFSVTRHAT